MSRDLLRCLKCSKGLLAAGYFVGAVVVLCPRCKTRNVFESVDGSVNSYGKAEADWFIEC